MARLRQNGGSFLINTVISSRGAPRRTQTSMRSATHLPKSVVQEFLARKKTSRSRNLQQDYAYGPLVVLGGGGRFLMSELPLFTAGCNGVDTTGVSRS